MKKWILITVIVVLIIIVSSISVFLSAMQPVKRAESIAFEIANNETDLENIEDFSLYNGSETYYVLKGTDSKGKKVIAWIPEEKKGQIIVKAEKDGISKEEAIQKLHEEKNPGEIMTVKLGIENNIPLWEIFYRSNDDLINYYYVDFESGEWLKDIQNL